MLELDEIFYNALTADSEIASATGGRIFSTCVEVPPMENDNTPLPYIVIRDFGKHPSQTTKDDGWMPDWWSASVGIEVGAVSPNDVDSISIKVMQAIANHIQALASQGKDTPYLAEGFPQTQGVDWDWTKPCYFDVVHYQCDVNNDDDDEI